MNKNKKMQVIIILRKFVMEKSFFVISSLLDIHVHNIFACSIIAFRAIDYPLNPHPHVATRHLHILCKICEHI